MYKSKKKDNQGSIIKKYSPLCVNTTFFYSSFYKVFILISSGSPVPEPSWAICVSAAFSNMLFFPLKSSTLISSVALVKITEGFCENIVLFGESESICFNAIGVISNESKFSFLFKRSFNKFSQEKVYFLGSPLRYISEIIPIK